MDKRLSNAQEPAFPLKAHMESMSDRTRALLEYYFDNDCRAYFAHGAVVEEPDVVIVDYDHPGSKASVAAGKWRTNRPLLLLSFSETDVPGAVLVRKPFDKHQLQQAALRLVEETLHASPEPNEASVESGVESGVDVAVDVAVGDSVIESVSSDPAPAAEHRSPKAKPDNRTAAEQGGAGTRTETETETETDTNTNTNTDPLNQARLARLEMKVALLCGPPNSIADLEASQDTAHRFTSANHLSGHIEKALQQCGHEGVIAVQLTLPTMEIYVLHWLQKILTTASLKSAKNVDQAFRALDGHEVKTTTYRSSTVNELVKRVNGTGKFSFSTEAFLWLSALFSARGRLPDDVQLDQKWRMVQWPNLTRLEPVPQSVETASAWSREPASIRQIITQTGHQPRHVISFFNGARALKLMEPVLHKPQTTDTASLTMTMTATDRIMKDKERPEQG